MRHLLIIPILLIPVAAFAQTAADQLTKAAQEAQCTRPDRKLIKVEQDGQTSWTSESAASVKYNRQAKGFNDCARVYVEKANVEITRIRDDTKKQLDAMADAATGRIRRIERQVHDAIERVKAVEGLASVASGGPDMALDAFPEAECKTPDEGLLVPLKGARTNSARERRYDGQIKSYEACMRDWVTQAKGEIAQIKRDTEAAMKPVSADANRQILEIWDTILKTVEQADLAQKEQANALAALKAQLAANTPPPAAASPPASESVVVTDVRLPRFDDQPTGAGDPDAIACRKAQPLPGQHLMGPEICKRNREWARLFQRGENVSPDGKTILEGEKQRTFAPDHCTMHTVFKGGVPVTETYCSQSAHGY
jgi:ElaB/YqjD/DUF883 family membrane-anchored ribosome-binding protein